MPADPDGHAVPEHGLVLNHAEDDGFDRLEAEKVLEAGDAHPLPRVASVARRAGRAVHVADAAVAQARKHPAEAVERRVGYVDKGHVVEKGVVGRELELLDHVGPDHRYEVGRWDVEMGAAAESVPTALRGSVVHGRQEDPASLGVEVPIEKDHRLASVPQEGVDGDAEYVFWTAAITPHAPGLEKARGLLGEVFRQLL